MDSKMAKHSKSTYVLQDWQLKSILWDTVKGGKKHADMPTIKVTQTQ